MLKCFVTPEDHGAGQGHDGRAIAEAVAEAQEIRRPLAMFGEYQFDLPEPIIIAGQAIEIFGQHWGTSPGNVSVIRKQHNTHVFDVRARNTCIRNLAIVGRGRMRPHATCADRESTPAIVLRATATVRDVLCARLGGKSANEKGTTGFAIGLIQPPGGNINCSKLTGIKVHRCSGDAVYVTSEGGRLNANAISVEIDKSFVITGYAVNFDRGFRSHAVVRHHSGPRSKGVFRIGYVENAGLCLYAEGDTALGVHFERGGRNVVAFQDLTVFQRPYEGLHNNTVIGLGSGKVFSGNHTGGHAPGFFGSLINMAGIRFPDGSTITSGDKEPPE